MKLFVTILFIFVAQYNFADTDINCEVNDGSGKVKKRTAILKDNKAFTVQASSPSCSIETDYVDKLTLHILFKVTENTAAIKTAHSCKISFLISGTASEITAQIDEILNDQKVLKAKCSLDRKDEKNFPTFKAYVKESGMKIDRRALLTENASESINEDLSENTEKEEEEKIRI